MHSALLAYYASILLRIYCSGNKSPTLQDWLEFVVFPEEVILNEPVERWPLCDCLISFHATDFPLHKAIEYERLRHPYVINDLHRQYDLVGFISDVVKYFQFNFLIQLQFVFLKIYNLFSE